MKRSGFLDVASRKGLIELVRRGLAASRLARRAHALVLLDNGLCLEAIAQVLLLHDDTIRTWHRLCRKAGIKGLAHFGHEGSACRLSVKPGDKPAPWITGTLPRTPRKIGGWIETKRRIACQRRSGLLFADNARCQHAKRAQAWLARQACRRAILTRQRQDVPRNWRIYCDQASDNVCIIA